MKVVKIDYNKCIGCKTCYDVCPVDIFIWDQKEGKPVWTYEEECWMCGVCWMDCPVRAIDVRIPASNW